MHTSCGSPLYVAPEILLGAAYTKAVDLWSLGVILYILLVGYPPFTGNNPVALYRQISQNQWGFGKGFEVVSSDAKDLVLRMMCPDPKKRITAAQALEHQWIKNQDQLGTKQLSNQQTLAQNIEKRTIYTN